MSDDRGSESGGGESGGSESEARADEVPPLDDLEALGWAAPAAPPGFAERTVAQFMGDEDVSVTSVSPGQTTRRTSRGTSRALWVGLVSVAAALLLWMVWPASPQTVRDSLTARTQRSVSLGDRAVAVASPGAVLRWEVAPGGATRVEQDAGRVFYRVDDGGAFVVKTPAGEVTVTGTCFEVETETMRSQSMKSAALGAALAAAVTVTVYEGSVVLANDEGEVTLEPGQRARADARGAPHRLGDDEPAADGDVESVAAAGASVAVRPDDAVAQVKRQARALDEARVQRESDVSEIEKLRRQVMDLGGEPGAPGPREAAAKAKRCATQSRGGGCEFLEPDQATLDEMARCAAVRVDHPGFLDNVESPEVGGYAGSLGITDPGEVEALQAAADAHYEEYNSALRDLFVSLGGDPKLAEEASAATMNSYIADQLDRELMAAVQRQVAQERAGQSELPADPSQLPLEEQAFRLQAELGNRFEQHVAEHLGAERARALRSRNDGWPGSTSVSSGNCIDAE